VKTRSQWILRVDLLDNYGRRFCRRDFPLPAGAAAQAFSLPLDACVSLAGRARLLLLRGQQPVDQVESEFFVLQRNEDYFPALVWGNLPGIFGHFCGDQLHRAGFNSVLHYYGEGFGEGRRPSDIAREDLHAIPYVAHIGGSWQGDIADLPAGTGFTEGLRKNATASQPYDPLVYSLGDENSIAPESDLGEKASAPSALSFSPATPMSLL
jgi:hypothetical protein